jgi:hypothetical protein
LAARTFIWISNGGGAWSLAANWNDQTDGQSPSTIVPGAQDSVVVAGPGGASLETITGAGAVAAALFTGNTILSGSFSAGTLTIGTEATGGVLQLAAGTSLQSTTASLAAGSLLVNGTGTSLSVAGTLGVGDGQTDGLSASFSVTDGGNASVLALLMDVANCSIYVDPASVLEVGGAGTGQAGFLTVDAGALLSGEGDANAYGDVANNGTIQAAGGTLALGAVSGTGTLLVQAGATLELNGVCGAGQTVDFAGANAVLDLQAEYYAPAGTLTGFAAGDAIDVSGSLISSARFSAAGAGGGVLTLYYGSQVADQIALAGNYAGSTFLTAGNGDGGTLITVAASESGGGTPSPGTGTPDQYVWVGQGSGQWSAVQNWDDQTSGASPAGIAPGVNDIVSVAASSSSFTVIGGPANAASLAVTGELGLAGSFKLGTLSIGQVSGFNFTDGTLDLLPGTAITATAATIGAGAIAVAGSGALLSVGGTLLLGGGVSGVGLPVTALTVTSGGKVQAASLFLGGGSGDSIATDPTSSVEIGTLGGAAAGAVTIDHGATLAGNGTVNPLGKIIDNGRIVATGGVLALGTVTGTGVLAIGNGTLELNYTTGRPIQFTSASSTLLLAGTGACPNGVLTGMVQGDVVDILGDPLTSAQFNSNASSTGGTVLLIYGSTVVGQFAVSGDFTQDQFINVPDGHGGTLVELAPNSGGGGGTGQSGTDQLTWNGAQGDGDWSNPGNWTDTTTGQGASLPPGTETPATMAAPTGTAYQSVSGTGTCASLALSGNTNFQGDFTIGTLTFGQDATATASAIGGTLVTYPGTTFTVATAFIADGLIQPVGDTTDLVRVTGTLTLGDGTETPSLIVQAGAAVQAGALVLGGGIVSVDAFSSVEIGALGTGAAGTLTIDTGRSVTGEGSLNVLGTIVDNGTITAQGGTLLLGQAGGSGSVSIATEATLSLTAAETLPIDCAGAGATLIIPGMGEMPGGTVSGFVTGDSIVVSGSPVDGVAYAPGTGGVGTLTLFEGGQVAGTILLAGNYAGDSFAVAPDGQGTQITVAASGAGGGPPAGTSGPDQYVWIGGNGVQWGNAANWTDLTQGQTPAAVAPGQNDLVTISAPGAVQDVNGPANSAVLTLMGTVALGGSFATGTLCIGTAQQTGMLALGAGNAVTASAAIVLGGIASSGGTLSVGGALTLGSFTGAAGLLDATGQSSINAGSVLLQGPGSTLETDGTATIEIGGTAGAEAGSVTVDADGVLEGNGTVEPDGQIVDDGLIMASGGTLVLGSVSGDGTLLVGLGASLLLEGPASSGLTVDFAGAGTLTLAAGALGAAFADFGPSDAIILPASGATSADYAVEAPGVGVLTMFDGTKAMQQMTVFGNEAGQVFSVSEAADGGTILTASAATTAGSGGDIVPSETLSPGSNVLTPTELQTLAQAAFPTAAGYLQALDKNLTCDVWYLDGSSTVGDPLFGGEDQPPGLDIELIAPTEGDTGSPTDYTLQNGYHALIAEGSEPVSLFDSGVGDALLVGTANADPGLPTDLVTYASGDTLVGGHGGNTVFWAEGGTTVTIQGGGNDTIVTNTVDASITTSGGSHSLVTLGASDNNVVSQGSDVIVCGGGGDAQDVITAAGSPGSEGPTVYGPATGGLTVSGGASYAIVVGEGGPVSMEGGASSGNVLWAGSSNADYIGGAGAGAVVGGSGFLYVRGGSAPVTVFGGTGRASITGGAPGSIFVVGESATTIAAGIGNNVFITDSAPVTVSGDSGLVVYAGQGTGDYQFNAGLGSETLWGGAGTDQFAAGTGNDNMISGGGEDGFSFTDGQAGGSDIIYNFSPGKDTIDLHGYGSAIPTLHVQGGSTYFSLSDGTHVEIYGVTNLPASSFSLS